MKCRIKRDEPTKSMFPALQERMIGLIKKELELSTKAAGEACQIAGIAAAYIMERLTADE